MKTILVCAATAMELKLVKKALKNVLHCKIVYHVYQVGIPLSLYYLNNYLHKHKIDFVLSVGIAGSFSKDIPLNSVVLVKQDCFGDMGVFKEQQFISLFDMGWINPNQKPFKKEQLINPYLRTLPTSILLPQVQASTVQQMTYDKKKIAVIKKKYNAEIESMEGACVQYVCIEKNIPFLQVRAISNFVGQIDKTKWSIKEALINLAQETKHIVKALFLL